MRRRYFQSGDFYSQTDYRKPQELTLLSILIKLCLQFELSARVKRLACWYVVPFKHAASLSKDKMFCHMHMSIEHIISSLT
jgi:hypothetical protein